ncbi:MAG: hypothetical protein H6581_20655 [Bacteroidia bacterium]|nr:hypothetical protein [Bacteroidia bacterium]
MQERRYLIERLPLKLNIVGVRSEDTLPNTFNDEIHVFTRQPQGNQWYHWKWAATTDPGTYWLRNPMQPQGTAILKEGQYPNAYQIDKHLDLYPALCQRTGKVTILRDYDRDAILDWNNGTEESGYFGINIHRALIEGTTLYVDRHSAGCQVFANASDFDLFMKLCVASEKLYGNSFTYTLIDHRSMSRKRLRIRAGKGLKVAAGMLLLSLAWKGIQSAQNQTH